MAEEKSGADQSEPIEQTETGTTENREKQPYPPPSTPPVGMGGNQGQDEPSAK